MKVSCQTPHHSPRKENNWKFYVDGLHLGPLSPSKIYNLYNHSKFETNNKTFSNRYTVYIYIYVAGLFYLPFLGPFPILLFWQVYAQTSSIEGIGDGLTLLLKLVVFLLPLHENKRYQGSSCKHLLLHQTCGPIQSGLARIFQPLRIIGSQNWRRLVIPKNSA